MSSLEFDFTEDGVEELTPSNPFTSSSSKAPVEGVRSFRKQYIGLTVSEYCRVLKKEISTLYQVVEHLEQSLNDGSGGSVVIKD